MQQNKVIEITRYRSQGDEPKKRKSRSPTKKALFTTEAGSSGSISDIWRKGARALGAGRYPIGPQEVRKQLDLIMAEIENGIFEFAKRFPHSKKKRLFHRARGADGEKGSRRSCFRRLRQKVAKEMEPGMSVSQIRDYTSILNAHHIPYFGDTPFSDFTPLGMKKFVAHLKGKKNQAGKPLSAKRIQNVMIPLRAIVKDAFDEFSWSDLTDPFSGLKLPKPKKFAVQPFRFEEWRQLMAVIPAWYRNYFEFAVQTGLRPPSRWP